MQFLFLDIDECMSHREQQRLVLALDISARPHASASSGSMVSIFHNDDITIIIVSNKSIGHISWMCLSTCLHKCSPFISASRAFVRVDHDHSDAVAWFFFIRVRRLTFVNRSIRPTTNKTRVMLNKSGKTPTWRRLSRLVGRAWWLCWFVKSCPVHRCSRAEMRAGSFRKRGWSRRPEGLVSALMTARPGRRDYSIGNREPITRPSGLFCPLGVSLTPFRGVQGYFIKATRFMPGFMMDGASQ